jgi:ABC-type dipeptide/oligopeptide/nickel transport system permease subunit
MKFNDFKEKCKAKASKIVAAVSGGAVMLGGAVTALAEGAGTDTEAVSAAKNILSSATGTLNIGNIVAIIGAGIGAVIGLFLAWWGARKLVRMLMTAFKKGKVSM